MKIMFYPGRLLIIAALIWITWLFMTVLLEIDGPITDSPYALSYYLICFVIGLNFPILEVEDEDAKKEE